MLTKLLAVSILAAAAYADTQTDQCHQHTDDDGGTFFNLSGLKTISYEASAYIKTGLS